MYSFGFQQAFRRGFQPEDHIFLEKVSHHVYDENGAVLIIL